MLLKLAQIYEKYDSETFDAAFDGSYENFVPAYADMPESDIIAELAEMLKNLLKQ